MSRALLLFVRFHEGRYHGAGDWPPSPARLFQALVSGAVRDGELPTEDRAALAWLEMLNAPLIATPTVREGTGVTNYVPNNDLDAVRGELQRIGEIRVGKISRPRLFDAHVPLLYVWSFDGGNNGGHHARIICLIAERLYQLGRGVDMAWAWGEMSDESEIAAYLAHHGGVLYRPTKSSVGAPLLCPQNGSLASLEARFKAIRIRLKLGDGRNVQHFFAQPPKPRFAQIAYGSPPARLLFDLRGTDERPGFAAWPLTATVALVEHVRDLAARKLADAMPDRAPVIGRVFIGRDATEADKGQRLRILPLPSIGHRHASPAIRRILVEVPPDCPLAVADVDWTFSGLDPHDTATGELAGWILVPAGDRGMLEHYGIEGDQHGASRLWRTVTPAALPGPAGRRRINPHGITDGPKTGTERANEEARAAAAVLQALRHAGVTTPTVSVRVQREPFEARGARAEAFAPGTRFAKQRLWHVEIAFAAPVWGPVILGDGRYLGLGLMAPVRDAWRDVAAFSLAPEAGVAIADGAALLHAVRRALMALSRTGSRDVPRLFAGHEPDGAPAGSGGHEHVFLAADDVDGDGRIDRVLVAAPWVCDRSGRARRRSDRALFDRVVSSLGEVRAGRLGVIALGGPSTPAGDDPLLGPAPLWESRTPYRPTRHAGRGRDARAALVQDVLAECERRGLPRPEVELLALDAGPNGGNLAARLRLRFAVAVAGPVMLGRDSHKGGGLFAAADRRPDAG